MNSILELRLKQEQTIRDIQNTCPHKEGNILGGKSGYLTSIWWHKLDNFWIGVCFHCGRRFYPGEPDYGYWYHKKPMGFGSTSGQEIAIDEKDNIAYELSLQYPGLQSSPFKSEFIYEWDNICKKFHVKDIDKNTTKF